MDWRVIFTELRVGVTIQLWIISLVCIGLAYLLIQGILYVKKRYKDIDQYRATVQHSVQIEYNKIATMKPEDLDNWLDKIFTSCIKMSIAAHYTPKDPINGETVYAHALVEMIKYIGPTTEEAINFFYGTDYIYRWCEMQYKLMDQTGTLSKLIETIIPSSYNEE